MRSPFFISGPAVISFSGGRTSGYMLHRILDAHGGKMPSDVVVLFCNTGKERTETLDFVRDCEVNWKIPIVWLERAGVDGPRNSIVHRVVSHKTASRDGTPFQDLIRFRGFLPGPGQRFCTQELKVRTIKSYVRRELRWDYWTNVVGLRADEPLRVRRTTKETKERWDNICPLSSAGVTAEHVMDFWRTQPFDLQLQSEEGNCDLCFLKSPAKRIDLMARRPEDAAWWIEQERWAEERRQKSDRFRPNNPSYADLLSAATGKKKLTVVQDPEVGDLADCACTD